MDGIPIFIAFNAEHQHCLPRISEAHILRALIFEGIESCPSMPPIANPPEAIEPCQ